MKLFKVFILTGLITFSMTAKSQIVDSLAVNNINASVTAYGELFRSGYNNPGFEAPKGSGNHTVFSNGFWMGGKTADETLHTTALTYAFTQNGEFESDFSAGPIAGTYSSPYHRYYQQTWKISKDLIEKHKKQYDDFGYTVPAVIDNWPAYQRPNIGINHHPAPFVDINNKGKYDPEYGDYPEIRGDKAIYFIVNDSRTPQLTTNGKKMNIEVKGMVYAYDSPNDPALANTVFVNYKITNHSGSNYKDVYLGNFTDFDIGYAFDDYIGCDPQRHLYFSYNGENEDDFYDNLPPATGGTFLSTPLNSFVYLKNDFSNQGNPEEPRDYYNYLEGKWKDGTPMTEGGDGYGQGGDTTLYLFHGDPADPNEWSEESAGLTPSDRRGLGVSGPFSLKAGETICLDMAFIFAQNRTQNDPDSRLKSVAKLKQRRDAIHQFYESQNFDCPPIDTHSMHTGPQKQVDKKIRLYPNPASDAIHFDWPFSPNQVKQVSIFNTKGREVKSQTSLKNERLSIDNLRPGIYIVQLHTAENVYRQKLLKK